VIRFIILALFALLVGGLVPAMGQGDEVNCEELPSDQIEECLEPPDPSKALVARSACNPVEFVYRPHRNLG
jgi:hypothetical protein